ncbi:response regulator [Caballeronia telluris]|uniref:Uncharacterized protein n=1 Tax=Caballeronia telluris TaxID=326475 RepID=A0A158K158_9BURK|nr:hypothetical protein AWB66_04974 [Caballeronia telluris]
MLFITGYAENVFFNGGQAERNMHVLTKPFTMDALGQKNQGVDCRRLTAHRSALGLALNLSPDVYRSPLQMRVSKCVIGTFANT